MAYNPIFPTTYNPMPYNPLSLGPVQQPQPQASPQTNIIWVSGEAGAKSYLVAPNTTVQLWDSERQSIYLKSADASGMPSIKILDYTIRNAQDPIPPVAQDPVGFATKEEVESLAEELATMKRRLDGLSNRKRHDKRQEVADDVQS